MNKEEVSIMVMAHPIVLTGRHPVDKDARRDGRNVIVIKV
jgi:hypothetical protein